MDSVDLRRYRATWQFIAFGSMFPLRLTFHVCKYFGGVTVIHDGAVCVGNDNDDDDGGRANVENKFITF